MSERRLHERTPIRLKVVYKSAHSLVTRYTTSVSKGGCVVQTTRALDVGTRFIFEMFAEGDEHPVEVEGEVIRVDTAAPDHYELVIKYSPTSAKRQNLERLLDRIFTERMANEIREHPRIPVNLVAIDQDDDNALYLVRDLSLGGIGLRLGTERELPAHVKVGSLVDFVIKAKDNASYGLRGEVVWTAGRGPALAHAALGVRFLPLKDSDRRVVASLQRLHRPEKVYISFTSPTKRKAKSKAKQQARADARQA